MCEPPIRFSPADIASIVSAGGIDVVLGWALGDVDGGELGIQGLDDRR
jgi:hypothetical protein